MKPQGQQRPESQGIRNYMKLNMTAIALLALVLLGGCSKTVEWDHIQKRGEIFYLVNDPNPYSGKAILWYENGQKHENGQKRLETDFVDGLRHGKQIDWYENGQKQQEDDYVTGLQNGKSISWSENGHKQQEVNYKYGKQILMLRQNPVLILR